MDKLQELIEQNRFAKVTAADFNGHSFDGAPLMPLKEGGIDEWATNLTKAMKQITIMARGHTDYAWFGIQDEYHNTAWAGPGDYLFKVDPEKDTLVVIPGDLMKILLDERV